MRCYQCGEVGMHVHKFAGYVTLLAGTPQRQVLTLLRLGYSRRIGKAVVPGET